MLIFTESFVCVLVHTYSTFMDGSNLVLYWPSQLTCVLQVWVFRSCGLRNVAFGLARGDRVPVVDAGGME